MNCKYCGNKIPNGKEFCPTCGKYAGSIHSGISQTQYKFIYAGYCFGISLLLLGLLFINHNRLFTGPLLFRGLDLTQRRNLIEVGVISAIVIIVSLIVMIGKRLRLSPWKCIYGLISGVAIFVIEFFINFLYTDILSGSFTILRMHTIICSLFSLVMLVLLILFGFLLKWISDVNILLDEDSEVVSAIFISIIAGMIATILFYILLC